ncbi:MULTISPECIES: DUF1869 domain-containing protein [Proteus]|uniref:DUF1869 domain-containing protein n=1 Tax=Proteus TaxID=583 RepID=UPI000BFE576D|nr:MULTISPECIES: DUF1869 domain-containing protein [Proteus]ATN01070.1 hypothetical protein CRN77_15595 [Proteus vulgaris]MBG2839136.1 DUF1869 domain-containing protein [Proteus terrae subsp. cibarius]MBG2870313.1 DUF1869 domain-containing protein [Proteus terrae subsp. cibarius]MBJ2110331.1 DUF1869 domain-containing protein [Proteus terrae]MBJ2134259.1 DUF1869 domain-containing protein [Proteus terrae]
MENENKGYLLELINANGQEKSQKIFLNPKILYIPEIATKEVLLLVNELKNKVNIDSQELTLVLTNKNNGVSVDKNSFLADLLDADMSSLMVKDLINIVRGYDIDEETNVCGW